MRIGGLIKFSLVDYPGRTAAIVFTQGCNFRCPFCHNPELVIPECFSSPLPEEDFFSFLYRRKGLLEGVVVSGGEPTIHQDLPEFLKKIKEMDYLVKLDTNGSQPGMLKECLALKLLDYIAMDIKAPLEKYKYVSGIECDIDKIQESIELIRDSNVAHEFRTTVVKRFHSPEDFIKMSSLSGEEGSYKLQTFIPRENMIDRTLSKEGQYTDEEMASFKKQWERNLKIAFRSCF